MTQTSHYVAAHRVKVWIERWSGMSVSDAVNVAIFVLTVVSLALAAAGVVVAVWTLRDAHRSEVEQAIAGEQQAKILDASRAALEKQEGILANLQNGITDQEKTLGKNIIVEQEQLKILQSQYATASQKPDLRVGALCQSLDGHEAKWLLGDPRGDELDQRPLLLGNNRIVTCYFDLLNWGTGSLQNGFLKVLISDPDSALRSTYLSDGMKYSFGHGWITASDDYIEIIQARAIFPSKKNNHLEIEALFEYTREFPNGGEIEIMVPEHTEIANITFEYGGSNCATATANIAMRMVTHENPTQN